MATQKGEALRQLGSNASWNLDKYSTRKEWGYKALAWAQGHRFTDLRVHRAARALHAHAAAVHLRSAARIPADHAGIWLRARPSSGKSDARPSVQA